jgi:2'-5' RNA ligase
VGIPTHITLMPPFEIGPGDLDKVEQHLAEAAAGTPPFRVHLRGTGTFRPVSPVVFVTVVEGISGCEQLAYAVRTGPLSIDLQFPYHPHVTVAHHLDDGRLDRAFDELSDFECAFEADHFSLYVHDDGTGWVPTRDFALTGASDY